MGDKITKRDVDTAQPAPARDVYIFDGGTEGVAGFGLKIRPSGAKAFIFQYRLGRGRGAVKKRVVIGRPGPALTVDQARDIAKDMAHSVRKGLDPIADKRAKETEALTVKKLCEDYLDAVEKGRVLTKSGAAKGRLTLATDKSRVNRHIIPLIGKKRAKDLTKADVEKMLRDIAAGKTATDEKTGKRGRAIVTGGQGSATRTVGLLGGIFTWAINDLKLRPDNPVRGVQRYRDRKAERFLSPAELGALGDALKAAEGNGADPFAVAAIRFLILSGCRKSEVLTLKWSMVDAHNSCLRLPASKTGQKIVPVGAAALALLEDLPRVSGNPYVFPGAVDGKHYVGLPGFFKRMAKAAELAEVRLHDLRHSFASAGAAGGLGLQMIGTLLGHKDVKTTERYAHLADSPVKRAADRISKSIDAAMGRKPKAKVSRLKPRGAAGA